MDFEFEPASRKDKVISSCSFLAAGLLAWASFTAGEKENFFIPSAIELLFEWDKEESQ